MLSSWDIYFNSPCTGSKHFFIILTGYLKFDFTIRNDKNISAPYFVFCFV